MINFHCLALLGCLAAVVYTAPCLSATAADQVAFTTTPNQVGLPRVGGKVRSSQELNDLMQQVIDREMAISYDQPRYLEELKKQACAGMPVCGVDVLTLPRVEVIPAKRLSKDILCTTPTCMIGLDETTTVSTTHSHEVGISAEVNASPFGMGVTFTTSYSYGFSSTNEASTTLKYDFYLDKGDFGYIGMASVQISARLRIRGCRCTHTCAILYPIDPADPSAPATCSSQSRPTRPIDETGHHEAVIMEGDVTRSIVAFVYI
ncbi:hypothetical protein BGZ83_005157 [Gryganskiella cystojenkinii]|nr:hypothetical protein BGZ83_005157 [Gryganskiella cystojenkinii]